MNPFTALHRVLFDAAFLRGSGCRTVRRAAGLLALWLLLAAVAGSAFRTYHALSGEGSLARALSRVSAGCVVRGGELVRDTGTGVPPVSYVRAALQAAFPGLPDVFAAVPESTVVFDTAALSESRPMCLVLGREALVAVGSRTRYELLRWDRAFGDTEEMRLDLGSLRRFLVSRWLYVWAMLCQWCLLVQLYKALTALPFFFIAAFILNPFGGAQDSLRRALLALLPAMAGSALEAAAGVDMVFSRYVLMGVGFFVLARAGRVPAKPAPHSEGNES